MRISFDGAGILEKLNEMETTTLLLSKGNVVFIVVCVVVSYVSYWLTALSTFCSVIVSRKNWKTIFAKVVSYVSC